MQHQRRLPDTDSNAETPASEEAIKVDRLSHIRRLCPVTAFSAIGKRLTAALAAARAVISNSVLPSSDDMSRLQQQLLKWMAFPPMLLMQCFKKVRQQSREQLLQVLV